MTLLILGLVVFLGAHSVAIVAPRRRDAWVARFGKGRWQAVYSLVSAAGLALIIVGYGLARGLTPVLYVPPLWLRYVAVVLMIFVFPMLLAAYLPGHIKRTLKHPMLVAVKTWAFAHLLANGSLADVVLFGALLAWAVADRISVKRRPAPSVPPALPATPWNDVIAVVGGIGIYAAFLGGLHTWLIGIPIVLR